MKTQSLAEYLALDSLPAESVPVETLDTLVHITDPKTFCERILESREFRKYVLNGITLGDLPPAVMCRIIDHAWGKPPERIEHTGKNGKPIETITEVRRIIIKVHAEQQQPTEDVPYITH